MSRLRQLFESVPWTLEIGDQIHPYGTVGAKHILSDGEKFYHFVDKHGVVSVLPASMFVLEKVAK